ncbi:TPA: hypothetical protein HA338_17095 [Methanosarcina acetivorans]|uniref:Uncharacterized protein n=1 Tax=Methanosarcina acetivorans TaxID=2214 RepID=A0A832W8L7_9EURY|nr:hypothetical protein [Methanosarcina acetivorans]HIH95644.1 hypothetical protein [Methanosarcina acetivorans]
MVVASADKSVKATDNNATPSVRLASKFAARITGVSLTADVLLDAGISVMVMVISFVSPPAGLSGFVTV